MSWQMMAVLTVDALQVAKEYSSTASSPAVAQRMAAASKPLDLSGEPHAWWSSSRPVLTCCMHAGGCWAWLQLDHWS